MSDVRGVTAAGLWAALLACVIAACSVDRTANEAYERCTVDSDCTSRQCHKGYCVGLGMSTPEEDAATPDATVPQLDAAMDAAVDAGADAGESDAAMPCSEEGGEIYCYSGPEGTDVVGQCRPGTRTCEMGLYGPCIGQVVPRAEECNDDDDDCDGETDEDLMMLATCATGLEGVCGEGALVCEGGRSTCEQIKMASTEVCDGEDNDCNGETDEGEIASAPCYPVNTEGCALQGGNYRCAGICKTGISLCEDGAMQDCADAVTPSDELCGPQGGRTSAEDEDCDGQIDEMCQCETNGERQNCYTGPEGTLDVGECADGEQECTDREWGTCLGDTLPEPETCANIGEDNDCNGQDFVPGGKVCVDQEMQGRCALGVEQCVAGELECVLNEERPEQCDSTDDDCDGHVDEDFDLQTDGENCGQCGNSCETGSACCNGDCLDTQNDERNCGGCGIVCGSGLTCCNGSCFNLQNSAQHCGFCGVGCSGGTPRCCTGNCRTQLCIL